MKLTTPEISWHGKEPVLSVDFCKIGSTMRFASAGADNDVKMWLVSFNAEGSVKIEFLANLSRHNKAVNVVRFAPNDELLASASDDGVIILWKINTSQDQSMSQLKDKDEDIENRESWSVHKILRGHIEDVYDLAWSPDGSQIVSGSVDNSAIVWDAVKGVKLHILKDHKHYVQGVCWDPLGQYIVTNSSDRSCRLYSSQTYRYCYNINRLPGTANIKVPEGGELKQLKMFHDETLLSFFRRPSFTPDGSLLIIPAGRIDMSTKVMNATFVFTRGSPNKPVLYLPSPKKPTVAVRCCPLLFELKKKDEEMEKENKKEQEASLFRLPYRMVFAVATLNSVLLYDTQHKVPFGYISNIHYSGLSDLTWSNDGKVLIISSTDGYCSIVQFQDDELGTPYEKTVKDVLENPNKFHSLNHNSSLPSTPAETPDNSGKGQKRVILTPVQQKMEVDETPDANIPKKKDTPQIDKFVIPVLQIPNTTPTKPTDNKLTPRRVQLVPSSPSPNVAAGPNPSSVSTVADQTVIPRHMQLVTTQVQQPVVICQNQMKSTNVTTGPNPSSVPVMAGQTAIPRCVQLVTTTQTQQPVMICQNQTKSAFIAMEPNPSSVPVIAGQTVIPRPVQLVATNDPSLAPIQTLINNVQTANVGYMVDPNRVSGQTGQAQPRQVQLLTMMPANSNSAQVHVTTGATCKTVPTVGGGPMIQAAKQTTQAQPRRVQLVTMVPANSRQVQKAKGPNSVLTVSAAGNANPLQGTGPNSTVSGQTAQARRVQLVSIPSGQTPISSAQTVNNNNNQNSCGTQNVQAISSKPEQRSSAQIGAILVPTNPVSVATSQPGTIGKQPTVTPTAPRRVQLMSVPSKEKTVDTNQSTSIQNTATAIPGNTCTGMPIKQDMPVSTKNHGNNTQNNLDTVKQTPRRIELSSLSISEKPGTAQKPGTAENNIDGKGEGSGKERTGQKRRIPLMTLSTKETIHNSNPNVNENASRKPIPLEPTIIVLD